MAKQSPKTKNYAQLSSELEGLMEWFDSGQVDLDEAITKHTEAVKLIKQMQDYLQNAKNKIDKLSPESIK